MNGRIYDQLLGRFLSADPVIPGIYNLQAYNRYTYGLNNPLRYIDPTGKAPKDAAAGAIEGTLNTGAQTLDAHAGNAANTAGTTSIIASVFRFLGADRIANMLDASASQYQSASEANAEAAQSVRDSNTQTASSLTGSTDPNHPHRVAARIAVPALGSALAGAALTKAVDKVVDKVGTSPTNVKRVNDAKPAPKKGDTVSQKPAPKQGDNTEVRGGPYGKFEDPPSAGPGKPFTKAQKEKIYKDNKARNGGILRDDRTGEELIPSVKSESGVTPHPNEAQIDHVYPRSEGGPNTYSNAEVRSRANNMEKSNEIE